MNKILFALTTIFLIVSCSSTEKKEFKKCWDFPNLTSISAQGRNPIKVYFNEDLRETAEKILKFAKKSDEELSTFYEVQRTGTYRIYLAKDRNQFEELTSKKRNWKKAWFIVGTALTENDAFILNPNFWDQRSHEYVKLNELVKHEMAHSFSIALNGKTKRRECLLSKKSQANTTPLWFEEGLATIASGQLQTWRKRGSFNFKKYPRFEQILVNYGNYTTAGSAVQFLIDKFGKEKVLSIIPKLPADFYNKRDLTNSIIFQSLMVHPAEKKQLEHEWMLYTKKHFQKK